MNTAEKILDLREDLAVHIEFKRRRDSDYPNFKRENRINRHIALLEAGLQTRHVKEIQEGFLIYNKFIVKAQKRLWRYKGVGKTYAFRDIASLVKKLKHLQASEKYKLLMKTQIKTKKA